MAITGPTLSGTYGVTGKQSSSTMPQPNQFSFAQPATPSFWGEIDKPNPGSPANPYGPNPQTFFAGINPFLARERGYLQDDYGLGMGYLGLQRSGTAAELAQLGPLRENAIALLGLDRERIGLGREGLNVDTGEAHRQAGTQVRGINSEYTAQGGWFAPEKGAKVEDTYANLRDTLARIDLERRGLDVDEKGVGLREQGTNLDFEAQRSALERQAQKYGLDAKELQMRLQRGLHQLNLQDKLSVMDLFGQSAPEAQALAERLIKMFAGG
jgi:hypothetical protein